MLCNYCHDTRSAGITETVFSICPCTPLVIPAPKTFTFHPLISLYNELYVRTSNWNEHGAFLPPLLLRDLSFPVGLMDDVASIFFRPDQYSPSLLPLSIPAASPSILPPHTLACKKRIWPPAFILNLPCYSNIYFSYLHLKEFRFSFSPFGTKIPLLSAVQQ